MPLPSRDPRTDRGRDARVRTAWMRVARIALITGALGLPAVSVQAAPGDSGALLLQPPRGLVAVDTPNDRGESIDLSWRPSPDDSGSASAVAGYVVERSASPQGPFERAGAVISGITRYSDAGVRDGRDYYYRVRVLGPREATGPAGGVVGPVRSRGQWFDRRKTSTAVLTVLFSALVLLLIQAARRGRAFYVRPIPGLAAVDEAIGRATEMGRPILFVTGLGEAKDVATLAAFTLLGRVARKTAEYQTPVLVPCYDPMIMAICQEIVRASYMGSGRPELYRENDVYFVTQDQFSYTAAVNGVILRDRPATNFFIGKFYAESLVLAETGNMAGSIQIAGTDEMIQIPFFVASCDYTLIGEELYASSAYLSQDPPLLGTLKAQDYGKAVAVALLLLGTALALANQAWFVNLLRVE